MKIIAAGLCLFLFPGLQAQQNSLTIEKIMRDPKWIGSSPTNPYWGTDQKLYFYWNPQQAPADSLYYISSKDLNPKKVTSSQKQNLVNAASLIYNKDRTAYVFSKNGDVYFTNLNKNKTTRITETQEWESNPQFSFHDKKVIYQRDLNLYAWDIAGGETQQLSNLKPGSSPGQTTKEKKEGITQDEWLAKDQLLIFDILKERKEKKEATEKYLAATRNKEMRSINIGDKKVQQLSMDPTGRYISYQLSITAPSRQTLIPEFVTESGYTSILNGRTKVGSHESSTQFYIFDRQADTLYLLHPDTLPGMRDIPEYVKNYPLQYAELKKLNAKRDVSVVNYSWSPGGSHVILNIWAKDNKDRWVALWNKQNNVLELISRQHDDAWIGGPGMYNLGWIDEDHIWYQSELTGYSHIYIADVNTKQSKALTSGKYEIQDAVLSGDKKYFYINSNEIHPGEQQFYKLEIATGKKQQITRMTGANKVVLSPDEKQIAFLYSYTNKPWELYLQPNKPGEKAKQITFKAQSAEFASYPWRDPEIVTFTARDGQMIYARVYKPATENKNHPAVFFVHGAGYLQNAHKWWSLYFREYMFNNMLCDAGYTVMDIDYRASAGYGRDVRTGIYRHMGGKDLTDYLDAIPFLVKNYGVNPAHIGLYGGSYGGFITLMALFTQPNVFKAGAALRPVTNWANYNQGYTSHILNEPVTDSIAYRQSSPLYFAEGLQNNLLICHGMVDVNVHYQDAVELAQKLIELKKENWELASYPLEDHGFTEPSSWMDEYKRIFKLFEKVLK